MNSDVFIFQYLSLQYPKTAKSTIVFFPFSWPSSQIRKQNVKANCAVFHMNNVISVQIFIRTRSQLPTVSSLPHDKRSLNKTFCHLGTSETKLMTLCTECLGGKILCSQKHQESLSNRTSFCLIISA
ncbi:hypothetical protein M758_10G141900 [Ceratodon purpureus]|nr:hypothetical protein M758_10G141900 [Ceratodon purpureus]